MSRQQLVQAWKNPELRSKMGVGHPSGKAFEELSIEEMVNIQGAGDIQPNTTPSSIPCGFGGGILVSMLFCNK
ncbi:mersacidin family lantibiotic [Cytobacillus massiliigabonensis]|uniref:mersacidin family lantibiotic n=1 Tax=Cytobacillus massiliigabonensis TaxID=1871011 RepID=UPI000C846922|nr:mersacidin family lantibiotic [Cytobacillus massiliigabonensis]